MTLIALKSDVCYLALTEWLQDQVSNIGKVLELDNSKISKMLPDLWSVLSFSYLVIEGYETNVKHCETL